MTSCGAEQVHYECTVPAHSCATQLTRRNFIRSAAALGITTVLPAGGSAQTDRPKIIDTHHHFFAPEYKKAMADWEAKLKLPSFPLHAAWTPAMSIEEMDKSNVSTAVLSLASTPGGWFGATPDAAARLARACNEYAAGLARDYPGRFGLFAALPMLDVDSSIKEIEYAFDTLKADGVGLQSNYGDTWPGDPAFRPIFEELNRRRALVYFHPVAANCCRDLNVGADPSIIEVPHDTARAVVSLMVSGTLVRFRDITWLFSHGGGTIPMLAGRIENLFRWQRSLAEFAPQGVGSELKRLYYDTASATYPSALKALLTLIPPSQIVFGSDHPYVRADAQLVNLSRSSLSESDLRAVVRENAIRLIPRLNR